MNTEHEVILNQYGEETGLAVPSDFGRGLAFLNPADMPNLESAEVGTNITPESFEFKNVGDNLRAIFSGFTFLTTKDRVTGKYTPKRAAVLQTNTGIKTNMGANLLKQLDVIPVGTAILITYKGEEKTKSGNDVKVYELNLLNVPRSNSATVSRTPAPQQPVVVADEEPAIEIVDTMHFWAVTEAAKFWNIEAGDAAKQISKAGLGKMEKSEFLKWLKEPNN